LSYSKENIADSGDFCLLTLYTREQYDTILAMILNGKMNAWFNRYGWLQLYNTVAPLQKKNSNHTAKYFTVHA
jgi:hypothetical protein